MSHGAPIAAPLGPLVKKVTMALNQAAGTYDIVTASGDVRIVGVNVHEGTAATGLTSVAIQTNQTSPYVAMTSTEGAVANLTADKNITVANQDKSFFLQDTKKLQMTIVGTGTAGTLDVVITYFPVTPTSVLV